MLMPNPSDDTRFIYGVSCNGWLLFGNLKKTTIMVTTVSTDASSTVISNATGTNAGQDQKGFPPMTSG